MRTASSLSRSQVQMILSKIPFFREFSADERERVSDEQSSFQVAREEEFIIRQGSHEQAFYILLSGSARVCLGEELELVTRLSPGDIFGEIGFLSDQPRTSHVIADQPSILIRVDRALIARFKAEIREKIKDQLIDRLLQRLRS